MPELAERGRHGWRDIGIKKSTTRHLRARHLQPWQLAL